MVQLITAMKNREWDAVYDQWGHRAYKPISQRFKNIMRKVMKRVPMQPHKGVHQGSMGTHSSASSPLEKLAQTMVAILGIDLTKEGEGDLETMCNLGEGIYEDGLMKGKQVGRKESKVEFALELLKDGVALDKIAQYTKLSLSVIEEIAEQNKLI